MSTPEYFDALDRPLPDAEQGVVHDLKMLIQMFTQQAEAAMSSEHAGEWIVGLVLKRNVIPNLGGLLAKERKRRATAAKAFDMVTEPATGFEQ